MTPLFLASLLLLTTPMAPDTLEVLDARPGVSERTFDAGSFELRYGLRVPERVDGGPRPLVLALHFGFDARRPFPPYYGKAFMERVISPGLAPLGAYIAAPDSHGMAWTDGRIVEPVLALLDALVADPRIDGEKVIVTGYSMGGAGTWFFAAEHTERFAAAVPMAGRLEAGWLEHLGELPVHVLHSRDDELISFERVHRLVTGKGLPNVRFTELEGISHYQSPRYAKPLAELVVPWLERVLGDSAEP